MLRRFLLVFCLLIFVCPFFLKWPDENLHFIVCDVGQGDALLFRYGFFELLVDTGPDESVLSCLEKELPYFDNTLEVVILTHLDDDHIGGFLSVDSAYQLEKVFLPLAQTKDSQIYLEVAQQLELDQQAGTELKQPILGQQMTFLFLPEFYSGLSLEKNSKYNSIKQFQVSFLTPTSVPEEALNELEENIAFLPEKTETLLSATELTDSNKEISENDGSIAVYVNFDQLNFLLVGDLESTRELALADAGLINKVDLLKVGHHGAKTSSDEKFLEVARPEISVISCGENNSYGHPSPEVIQRLAAIGSHIFRSDTSGTLHFETDGEKIWLKEQKNQILNAFL
jgi:competence protein ComEC